MDMGMMNGECALNCRPTFAGFSGHHVQVLRFNYLWQFHAPTILCVKCDPSLNLSPFSFDPWITTPLIWARDLVHLADLFLSYISLFQSKLTFLRFLCRSAGFISSEALQIYFKRGNMRKKTGLIKYND